MTINVFSRTEPNRTAGKSRRFPLFTIVILLTAILLGWFYLTTTRLPNLVRIGGGPEGGRYFLLAHALAHELEERLDVQVDVVSTGGSLRNLQSIQRGQLDFALYQSATQEVQKDGDQSLSVDRVRFVSNLFPEYLIPCESAANSIDWNHQSAWHCNNLLSGDYAMLRWLSKHVDNVQASRAKAVNYIDMPAIFQQEQGCLGILCCGLNAPILKNLLVDGNAKLKPVPALDAFAARHPSLSKSIIPQGYFQTAPPIPAADFPTVSLKAQLITRDDLPVRLVEEVTRIVAEADFQRQNELTELFRQGKTFATDRPEFLIHPGASHIYSPELKPLLNPDFVEATEGLRSFIVSLLAAIWLLRRWWLKRRIRSQEHRLDRYIKDLLQLERDQMELDGDGGDAEASKLQEMLDRVTILRQEALAEFTAHELNEDRAVDCFIEMCHALSDKINAKLTRSVLQSLRR